MLGPLVNPILFSYPSKIAVAFYELTISGELPYYAWRAWRFCSAGCCFAIVVGVPLAVLMARFKPVDWALDLPINALYATPMVALVPLLVLWFGIYMQAKIIVVFLFAVFPILINTYQGVRECDKNMLEVARSFRSPRMEDVAGRAAAVRAALHRGRHPARDRPRPGRHGDRRVLHHDQRARLHDQPLRQHVRDGQDLRAGASC